MVRKRAAKVKSKQGGEKAAASPEPDSMAPLMSAAPVPLPTVLYHYGPMEAVRAILTHGCIWLSDAAEMNDALEGKWLDKVVERIAGGDEWARWREAGHILHDYQLFKKTFYIACVSEDGNLLSQWRAYADDGRGASIGFDSGAFAFPQGLNFTQVFHMDPLGCTLDRVVYEEREQLEAARRVFSFIDQMARTDIIENPYSYDALIDTGRDCLSYAARLLKHPGFREEREWRIVYDGQADRALSGIGRERKSRVRGAAEIGYFPFEFRHAARPLRELVLGPKCAMTVEEAAVLLERCGYGEVVIRKSDVPYR
jgi:hypothetical protein